MEGVEGCSYRGSRRVRGREGGSFSRHWLREHIKKAVHLHCVWGVGGSVRTSVRGCPIQHTRGVSKEQGGLPTEQTLEGGESQERGPAGQVEK